MCHRRRRGLLLGDRVAANLSGTLVLAPALTALSHSRACTLLVGVVAVLAAVALSLFDGVPWVMGLIRTLVVVASAGLSALVAHLQGRQWAQLQDRRQAARTLQAAMLTRLPRPDHLQLTSRYLPASTGDQVGGDWYDAVVDADGCIVLIIGDVVGHDIHAAAAMGQLRGLLRAYAVEGGRSPAQVLIRAEENATRLGLEVLASVVVARIEQDEADAASGRRRLRWSNAGHPPPVLLLPESSQPVQPDQPGDQVNDHSGDVAGSGPQVVMLSTEPDPLLGVELTPHRHDQVCSLTPGATLLLYTDGLIERRGENLDEGLTRLRRAALEEAGTRGTRGDTELDPWLDAVLRMMLQEGHPAGRRTEQPDDVAVLAVRVHPEDRPRPPAAGPLLPRAGRSILDDLEPDGRA